jgi:hypothetical protein
MDLKTTILKDFQQLRNQFQQVYLQLTKNLYSFLGPKSVGFFMSKN